MNTRYKSLNKEIKEIKEEDKKQSGDFFRSSHVFLLNSLIPLFKRYPYF